MRFYRQQHIRTQADFSAVRRKGRRIECHAFRFFGLKKESDGSIEEIRLGVVASRRVGNAVVRNRLKRRIREIFRLNQEKIMRGVDIVVVLRASAFQLEYKELEERFLHAVERAHILGADGRSQNDD
jgi:ribonuclease P protein component